MGTAQCNAAWLTIALIAFGCRAPAPAEPRFTESVPPLVEPTSFRIETTLCEMPVAIAAELYRSALDDATLAVLIDEHDLRRKLAERARVDPAILLVRRAVLVVEPGRRARIPERAASERAPPGTLASDGLVLEIAASFSLDWAPTEIEVSIDWRDRSGRQLGRLPGSRTPLPEDHALMIACLPARDDSATVAILAFVLVIPLKDGELLPDRRL